MIKNRYILWLIPILLLSIVGVLAKARWDFQVSKPSRTDVTLGVRVKANRSGSVTVQSVTKDGRQFGLQVGDAIVQVDGQDIKSRRDFVAAAAKRKTGDKISVVINRNNSLVSYSRKYLGAIGLTRIETAASQGIKISQRSAQSKPKIYAASSENARPALDVLRQTANRIVGGDVKSASKKQPPKFVPRFEKSATWIEL